MAVEKRTRSAWYGHGFWNIFEHGLSRGMDAVATLAIVWLVPTEVFSQLGLSQAYVATALFFFVAPEAALYRHFSTWSAEGRGALLTRLRAFRRFAWAKGLFAFLLAGLIAAVTRAPVGTDFSFFERFCAIVWAFCLPLLPQICGPDREFLRLSLELKVLNTATFFQRAIYLLLLIPLVRLYPHSFPLIALCAVTTTFVTAILVRTQVEKKFAGVSPTPVAEGAWSTIILNALRGFSLWNHIAGVIVGWLQTLDLFFLGWFRLPAAEIGIYSVVLKLSNFTLSVPYAVSNLYQVYLGRTPSSPEAEKRQLFRFSGLLVLFTGLQAALLYWLSPVLLSVFSRGRWLLVEQVRMVEWLKWILPSAAIFGATLCWVGWLSIRTSFRRLVFAVYLPWAGAGLILYAWAAAHGGADAAARANLSVMAVLVVLLSISSLTLKKSSPTDSSSL